MPGTLNTRVQMDPAKIAAYLRSPQGPLLRHQIELGEAIKAEAQATAPVYQPPAGAPSWATARGGRQPGTFKNSIVKRITEGKGGLPVVLVGSDDPIAALIVLGTPAHGIVARIKPLLVFWSAKAGRVIRTKAVQHPGTKPNTFLTDAVDKVLRGTQGKGRARP